MKIINNITEKLADDLRITVEPGSRVSVAAACFSVYAFEELRTQLERVSELRFIFTSPAFLEERPERAQREFYIPPAERPQPKSDIQGVRTVDPAKSPVSLQLHCGGDARISCGGGQGADGLCAHQRIYAGGAWLRTGR